MSSYFEGSDSDEESQVCPPIDDSQRAQLLESVGVLKNEGNGHFSKGEYEKAVEVYSSALSILKTNHLELDCIVLLNRCAAYLALKRFVPALSDANRAIEIDSTNWKGHWRKGMALMSMSKRLFRTKQAIQAFESCLACPTLPSEKRAEVGQEIMKAKSRMEQQEAEPPPPDLSKCAPS